MSRRILQGRLGRSLALVALAVYGSAGVFGYGLHALWDCEHCPTIICGETSAAHGHDHAGHDHGWAHSHEHGAPQQSTPHQSTPLPSTVADSHDDCTICSFLAQAQSRVVPPLELDGIEPLSDAPHAVEALVLAIAGETPQARGPPLA